MKNNSITSKAEQPRERLGSRLGFILLSAGCAIGIGNVWKFPYMVGQYGGGAFVLIYLFFLTILGVPIMTVEFTLGRASRKSPVKLYQELEPKGSKWHIHGYFALVGNYLLMMFYTTVAGWMLQYFTATATGKLSGDAEHVSAYFDEMLASPVTMIIFMAIIVIAGFAICSIGLQKGLEKITKVMMTAMLFLILIVAVYSVSMDKSGEGLKFYLVPSIEKIKEIGIHNVAVAAMTQAFFTLSIGIGNMAIFGSYIDSERSLLGEAVNVAALDSFVALAAGFIIFPVCFAFGGGEASAADSGPSLIFKTLPNIFNRMPGGRIFGSLFFVFLIFAAFSTVLTVFENILTCCCELFGISRKKSCFINCIILLILSVPCVLGFNVLSGFEPFGANSSIMDLEDFIVSNVLLPLGSFVFVIFSMFKFGWGWDKFKEEANRGKGLKVKNWMRVYMTYVLPAIIIVMFCIGIITKITSAVA